MVSLLNFWIELFESVQKRFASIAFRKPISRVLHQPNNTTGFEICILGLVEYYRLKFNLILACKLYAAFSIFRYQKLFNSETCQKPPQIDVDNKYDVLYSFQLCAA